jgi:hypothetical protein
MPNAQLRMNVRNFLVGLNKTEIEREWELSIERGDMERAECIDEYLDEEYPEW